VHYLKVIYKWAIQFKTIYILKTHEGQQSPLVKNNNLLVQQEIKPIYQNSLFAEIQK